MSDGLSIPPYHAIRGVCTGTVEVWDQTIGCPECMDELWNYPYMKVLGLTDVKDYERRFAAIHPFMFEDAHDDGDENDAPDEPYPGEALACSYGYRYGCDWAKWPERLLEEPWRAKP